MKCVMKKKEERNNDAKEEVYEFETIEVSRVRVLGSWISAERGMNNRIRRSIGF